MASILPVEETGSVLEHACSPRWDTQLERFREECRQGLPDFRQLRHWVSDLPAHEQLDMLVSLIAEHLEQSWKAGQPVRLNDYEVEYGGEFPALRSPITILADLVEAEFLARYANRTGDFPDPDEYRMQYRERPDVWGLIEGRLLDGGRYVKLRRIGQGGLGQVWQAYDRHLRRQVAIKEPLGELGDPEGTWRLLANEARVTAGLDHQAIVPVHEYRHNQDEPPFYVMRLVEGRTLREAVQDCHRTQGHDGQRQLPLKLLQAFSTVCDAVAFAHAQHVIHCDLKPENVRLGPFGETVLLDWGLAKRLESGAASPALSVQFDPVAITPVASDTQLDQESGQDTPSDLAGTLPYMAPEQVDGRADKRTDVFGLGAILCEILTGMPPFIADSNTTTRLLLKVKEGDLAPAHGRLETCGGDPELISLAKDCLKKNSAERLRDAGEVAHRATAYLTGLEEKRQLAEREKVAANARATAERRSRWFAYGLGAVGLLLALVVSGWALRESSNANEQLNLRTQADKQRDRATHRFNQVRELANKFVNFDEQIRTLAGSTPARKSLVQDALSYLDDLGKEAGDDLGLLHEISVAYSKVGDVQGNPYESNLGDTMGAIASYHQALRRAEALAGIDSANIKGLRDRMISHNKIGDMQRATGKTPEALASYQKGLDLLERLASTDPDNGKIERDRSVSYGKIGHTLSTLGRTVEARANHEKTLGLLKQLGKHAPDDVQIQRDLAVCYANLAGVQGVMGQTVDALASFQESLGLIKPLAKIRPRDAQVQRDLAVNYNNVGDLLRASGRTGEARTFYRESLSIAKALADADPKNALAQRDQAVGYERMGEMYEALGQTREALASNQRSRKIREALASADPDNFMDQRELAVSHERIGDIELVRGYSEVALTSYQKSYTIRFLLAKADPENASTKRDLSVSYNKIGDAQKLRGKLAKALASYQEGFKIREQLAKADPKNAAAQRDLAVSYNRVGHVHQLRGETVTALGHYHESLKIGKVLVAAQPINSLFQDDLSVSHEYIGNIERTGRKPEEAQKSYSKSLEIREALADRDRENAYWRRALAVSYEKLGDVYDQLGDVKNSQDYHRKCLNLRQELAKKDPENAEAQLDLATSYERRGMIMERSGNRTRAKLNYEESFNLRLVLLKVDPENATINRAVAVSHERLGDLNLQSDPLKAEKHYLECRNIRDALLALDPQSFQSMQELLTAFARLGDVCRRLGRPESARDYYLEHLNLAEALMKASPESREAQRNLSIAFEKHGGLSLQLKDLDSARKYYRLDLDLAKKLDAETSTVEAKHDLAVSYNNIGKLCLLSGDPYAARQYFQDGLKIDEELVNNDPDRVMYQTDLAFALLCLGHAATDTNEYAVAYQHYDRGAVVLEKLHADGRIKDQSDHQAWLRELQRMRGVARNGLRAIDDLESALAGERKGTKGLLKIRARVLASRGEHAKAVEALEKLRELAPKNALNIYNVSCSYSLCAAAVAQGKPRDQLKKDRADAYVDYISHSVKSLTLAVDYGYRDLAHLEADRDLVRIRQEAEYRNIVKRLKKQE